MFRQKKLLVLAGLLLVVALLMAAPNASSHPEDDCHFWLFHGFSHTIEEGDTVCFYVKFLQATPGLLRNLMEGTRFEVSIKDVEGKTVVQNELGQWGPIEKTDPAAYDWEECPMPTIAISRWEYSPESLHLEPGTYTVWFSVVVERPVVDGYHMCRDLEPGPPFFTLPEDSVSWPVLLTVEAAE